MLDGGGGSWGSEEGWYTGGVCAETADEGALGDEFEGDLPGEVERFEVFVSVGVC